MMELFSAAARLVLDKTSYDKDVNEADKQGKTLAENLTGYMEKAKKVLAGVVSVVAVKKVASSLWDLAKETSAAGDRIDKMSQSLGMSRKAYQEWDYILAQSGADVDSLGQTMKTMNEAITGNSAETAVALSKLGLSAAKLQNLSPEEQFEEIVKAFQKMPPSAQKSQYAMLLFGRNAQSLMPLLNSASGSVDDLRNRAHELGLIMSDEDVDASVAFGDALDDLGRVWTAIKQKFGAQMLPTFTKGMVNLANSLGRVSNAVQKAFKTGDWSGVFDTITNEIKTLLPGFIDTVVNIGVGLFQNADKIISLGFSIIMGLISGLREHIPTLVAKAPEIFSTFVDGVVTLGTEIGNGLIDAINAALGTNIPHIEDITWPSWDDVKTIVETSWKTIVDGVESLGKILFGEKVDGTVDWPDWDDFKAVVENGWKIVETAFDGLFKLVFGTKVDGSINWPTWETLKSTLEAGWATVKNAFMGLFKLIFGTKVDGTINWPTWENVKSTLESGWATVKNAFLGLFKLVFGTKVDGEINWPTWETVKSTLESGWKTVKNAFLGLFKIVFGTKVDGSIDWPTWETLKSTLEAGWKVVENAFNGLLKLMFGEKVDGSIDWPTWETIKTTIENGWKTVTEAFEGLLKLVFGDKVDGNIVWPVWDTLKSTMEAGWTKVKNSFMGLFRLIFGTKVDGNINWPDWENLKSTLQTGWATVKNAFLGLFKLIFDAKVDDSINWPKWTDIENEFNTWWSGPDGILDKIKAGTKWVLQMFGLPELDAETFASTVSTWFEDFKNYLVSACSWTLALFGLPTGVDTNQLKASVQKWFEDDILGTLVEGCAWVLGMFGLPTATDEKLQSLKTDVQAWFGGFQQTLIDACEWTLGLFGFIPKENIDLETLKKDAARWFSGLAGTLTDACEWTLRMFGFPEADLTAIKKVAQIWFVNIASNLTSACQWTLALFGFPNVEAETLKESASTWFNDNCLTPLVNGCNWVLGLFGLPEINATELTNSVSTWFVDNVFDILSSACQWTIGIFSLPKIDATMLKKLSTDAGSWFEGVKSTLVDACGWVLGLFKFGPYSMYTGAFKTWWEGEDGEGGVRKIIKNLADWAIGDVIMPAWNDVVNKITTWWNNDILTHLFLGITPSFAPAITRTVNDGGTVPQSESNFTDEERQQVNDAITNRRGFGLFAKGLNYVPYDNYRALLHRGETVLNRSQAQQWRNGGSGFDSQELYSAVASAVSEAVANIQINMNGKAVANAVTRQVSRNQYMDALGRRYVPV